MIIPTDQLERRLKSRIKWPLSKESVTEKVDRRARWQPFHVPERNGPRFTALHRNNMLTIAKAVP